ncbi:ATP-dependent RNA helicase DHX58 [Genypterus blacodes]|uniref:ATP-dependent RNA helicase DHX58 n=1 Tax=Genypterus blacodes TaxID=154954 RepID=UPI003F75E854
MASEFGLYNYQQEVTERAVQGENVIIWLPTGGGKTRAAVYVAMKHLETTPNAKVVVQVNMVHLVDQHFNNEFGRHLGSKYRLKAVSGECDEKDFFGKVMKATDLVICTAQILHNALMNEEEGKHVELSDITLLIIDECHHAHKEHPYNQIMRIYVEKKLRGEKRLPQILGLTASPGTGNAKSLERAVDHVLEVCANLDSAIVKSEIYAPELKKKVPRPVKTFALVDKRLEDLFEDHLKRMMQQIHEFMVFPVNFRLRETGTQEYEADVVELEKCGVRNKNSLLRKCALHLREYNDALLINDELRTIDAYQTLEDFYGTKHLTAIDGTDIFLLGMFQENKVELKQLATDPRSVNPKMVKLESTLLEQFSSNGDSKGIIFCKTRKSTHCLNNWIYSNGPLLAAGIVAAVLTGAGNGSTYMTLREQKDIIKNFREDRLNLLIATSVAEEGLDIPECNLVVRYGLLTNEIAQQQASGRARATDSVYAVVTRRGGREERRERLNDYLEGLTSEAIAKVQEMSPDTFRTKILELQKIAVRTKLLKERTKMEKKMRNSASSTQLLCRNCFRPVATGSDIKLVDNAHYVNVNPDFQRHYAAGETMHLPKSFEDWEPGRRIRCKECKHEWGYEMKYRKVALLPNLAIKSFAVETAGGPMPVKQWKGVPFLVEPFDFVNYCDENHSDLFD